jgi:hypothetical protein
VHVEKPDTLPNKPIHLGVFLLGISRVIMSEYYTKFNAYKTATNTIDYGDTDSMIVSTEIYMSLKSTLPSLFGKGLGQLDDELKGGLIIHAYYPAPKVYFLEYVLNGELRWKIRAKGIPGGNRDVLVKEWMNKLNDETSIIAWHQEDPLQRPVYIIKTKSKNYISDLMDDNIFDFLNRGEQVKVCFGMMKKSITKSNTNNVAAVVQFNPKAYRTLNQEVWWMKGHRSLPLCPNHVSYPKGHYMYTFL